MGRLGAPAGDDTILRHLKRRVADRNATTPVRVAGIDDWSWRKGSTYGAIVVDLERREVVDVLPDRSAAATANWLRGRPEVEVVSRDRCGLFAQGAREGAPQARQVADRFHLLQNFQQAIERQLSRAGRSTGCPLVAASSEDENGASCFCSPSGQRQVAEHKHLVRHAHRRSRQESFDQIRDLHKEGMTLREIAQRTGFHWRSIAKWVQLSAPAERTAIAPKPSSPKLFSGLSAASLGGGVHRGPTSVRRNQTPRLRRQLLQLGAIVGEVATHRRRRAASHRHAYGPSRRSDDRLVDLADRRGCALHQTARLPESGTSGENRGA